MRTFFLSHGIPGRWVVALAVTLGTSTAMGADFAEARHADQWLRHPVYGDPSFDSFERVEGNPIFRGAPPFEWPVNGFLFHDPVGGNDYAYVGDYCKGYLARPSRCILLRSDDGMKSWANLGVVLQGNPEMFDRGGHTPDVSVVFDAGRYHMVYDWGEADFNAEGGLAYAWAEKPEGPWHRAPEPITRNSTLPRLLGRYQRTYAGTLIRRKNDWLIIAMTDAAPNSWALFASTAPRPEGPWTERRIVRNVEADYYHPPLLEFFPAFVRGRHLYAPATSVALNRNFNVLFRAPLERADEPSAWEITQNGSLWHSEDIDSETYGLWGQTFSGTVDARGTLWALFNSRDALGIGTVNLARRPWNQPLRPRGFVLTAHEGPSFTCLRQTFRQFKLETAMRLRGTISLIWNYRGALGPDVPRSDATLHRLAWTSFDALTLSPTNWEVIRVDKLGRTTSLAQGAATNPPTWKVGLECKTDGESVLELFGRQVWSSHPDPASAATWPGPLGLWASPHSHLEVERFEVRGHASPARLNYVGTEALLGAGENLRRWQESRADLFRFGVGFVGTQPQARVKWNVSGSRFTLWSPRGPDFGQAEIRVDGKRAALVDIHADVPAASQPVWTSRNLPDQSHAIVWQAVTGMLPVDCLQAEN